MQLKNSLEFPNAEHVELSLCEYSNWLKQRQIEVRNASIILGQMRFLNLQDNQQFKKFRELIYIFNTEIKSNISLLKSQGISPDQYRIFLEKINNIFQSLELFFKERDEADLFKNLLEYAADNAKSINQYLESLQKYYMLASSRPPMSNELSTSRKTPNTLTGIGQPPIPNLYTSLVASSLQEVSKMAQKIPFECPNPPPDFVDPTQPEARISTSPYDERRAMRAMHEIVLEPVANHPHNTLPLGKKDSSPLFPTSILTQDQSGAITSDSVVERYQTIITRAAAAPTISTPSETSLPNNNVSSSGHKPDTIEPVTHLDQAIQQIYAPSSHKKTVNRDSEMIPEKGIEPEQKELSPEIKNHHKSIRSKLAVVLGSMALTVLGGIGTAKYLSPNTDDRHLQTPSVTSNSANKLNSTPAPIENKVEAKKAFSKGVYKVNLSGEGYLRLKDYLRKNQLMGIEAITRDLAGQINILYLENPQEAAQARAAGKTVMTGVESQEQINDLVFIEFLKLSQTSKLDNPWVQKVFFGKMLKEFQQFKESRTWPANSKDAQLYYSAFQNPSKFLAEPGVIGYAPDLNLERNPSLSKMKDAAPTFYDFFRKASQSIASETDPRKVPAYKDAQLVKKAVCDQILIESQMPKVDKDVRSGVKYMHGAWCNEKNTGPFNYLNQAVKHLIEVKGVSLSPQDSKKEASDSTAVSPVQPNLHNNIAPQQSTSETPVVQPDQEQQQKSQPQSRLDNDMSPAISENQSWYKRIVTKAKGLFSKPASPVTTSPEQVSKANIPMLSWKKTLKEYLGV